MGASQPPAIAGPVAYTKVPVHDCLPLRFVVFTDGLTRGTCQGEQYAYTTPGNRVVFVCVSRFTTGWRNNPAYAEASLIHEVLHTLGLGENPPSSSEITDRVRNACGRL